MIYGKTARVRNFTSLPVSLTYINNSGSIPFAWHIDPYQLILPQPLASGDSLNLTVKLNFPLSTTGPLSDTLWIDTPVSSHPVILYADPLLLTGLRGKTEGSVTARVFPNPMTNQLNFEYNLLRATRVQLQILTAEGSLLANLVNEMQTAGEKNIHWDGCGATGHALPSGLYFYRLTIGSVSESGKIAIIR